VLLFSVGERNRGTRFVGGGGEKRKNVSKHRTKLGTLMYEAFVGEEERKEERELRSGESFFLNSEKDA
jgi:hypothetical protein